MVDERSSGIKQQLPGAFTRFIPGENRQIAAIALQHETDRSLPMAPGLDAPVENLH
ncbi:MAG: hypothetical protein ABI832_22130 [bacterium]